MQTCPYCHNALLSYQGCCSHSALKTTSTSLVSQPQGGCSSLSHTTVSTTFNLPSTKVCNGTNPTRLKTLNCGVNSLCSIPTPQVSGHLFHFPTFSSDLAQRLSTCQLTCHINCITHGRSHCSSVSCSDSGQSYPGVTWGGCGSNANVDCSPADESLSLEASKQALNVCGWYWSQLTWQEAEVILQPTDVGTFLVRDSANQRYRFSLSVQTENGPTSVRLRFYNGLFRLNCEPNIETSLPEFSSVIALVQYYIRSNEKYSKHVWLDASGKVHSTIRIRKPFQKSASTLKHLSRKSINRFIRREHCVDQLPETLLKYIDGYPYWC